RPKPGYFSSSTGDIAHSVPGRANAPTSRSPVNPYSTRPAVYRSMPRLRAFRTRISVNGFAVLLIATSKWMTKGVCWTTTLSPRCLVIASTSLCGRSRNSMWARPERIAAARTAVSVLTKNLYPFRYGRSLTKGSGFRSPSKVGPRAERLNLNRPEPTTLVLTQVGSRSRYFLGKMTFQGEARFTSKDADGNLSLKTTVLGSGASTLATDE